MVKSSQSNIASQIIKYSLCFLLFASFCVCFFFLLDNKSMFDQADGIQQKYTYFINCGQVTRKLFQNIIMNHIFEFPMWDRTIGMGSDTLLIYNPLATPLLGIISALIPARYSEFAFNLIILIRFYLSGLAFLMFAYEKGYKSINAISGSIVYVFSTTTYIIFLQMNFSMAFILFPLLLLGANRIWEKNQCLLYVIVLAYSTILSYYFTYMMLILLVVYCIIRFIFDEKRSFRYFCYLFGKFVLFTLISLFIGLGMIFPSLINLSKLSRLKSHYEMKLIDLDVLTRFFLYGFSCFLADIDSLIGVSSFSFVSAVCLLTSKKREPILKCCLSLCLLSFAFPFIGSVFNGFNYSSYRYIFSLILCISYMVTVSFDSIRNFKGIIWYVSIGISLLYCAICFLIVDYYYSKVSAISLAISVLAVGLINHFNNNLKSLREKLYVLVIFISCAIIGYTFIHTFYGQMLLDWDSVYEKVYINNGMSIRKAIDNSQFRTDTINSDFTENIMNSSMVVGVSGYDFYHSNQNQSVEDYYSSLAILGNPTGFSHTGFRGRCYLEILNACNYLTRSEEKNTCIRTPYTYDYVKTENGYSLYKATKGVSLVYFYDNTISYDAFMELNPVDRETNLMYSMVIDNPEKPDSVVTSDTISIPFKIVDCDNILIDGEKIIVQQRKGYITLKPEEKIQAGQVSVYISSLTNSNVDNWHYRNSVELTNSNNEPIVIDYSAQFPTTYRYYIGNDDIIFSFEKIDEEIDTIRLYFHDVGEYDLKDVYIFSRPYDQMDLTLDAFYEHADMENIRYEYEGNHLCISATSDSDRYLYIAIPYSEGWNAKVDGETTEIIRANIAFMAIPLSSGTHTIEMTYTTPYLYIGWIISAFGIATYIGYMIYARKRNTRNLNASN